MIRVWVTLLASSILIGASAILLWQAYHYEPALVSPSAGRPAAATPAIARPLPTRAPLEQSSETLTRPLFVPGRRPPLENRASTPPVPPQVPTAPPPRLERARLLGIRIDGSDRSAFIDHPLGSRWVVVGDLLDRWRVEAIESDRAELSWQDQREVLKLHPALTPQ